MTLRLETGDDGRGYAGNISGSNITCVNGSSAFMAQPHCQANGEFHVTDLVSIACNNAMHLSGGFVSLDKCCDNTNWHALGLLAGGALRQLQLDFSSASCVRHRGAGRRQLAHGTAELRSLCDRKCSAQLQRSHIRRADGRLSTTIPEGCLHVLSSVRRLLL